MPTYPTIRFQTEIIQTMRKDNVNKNTIHFISDRASFGGNYILRVVTHNIKTQQNFLYKQVDAESEHECWAAMVHYVKKDEKYDDTWTIRWKLPKIDEINVSFFKGRTESEVRSKFHHDNYGDIVGVIRQPKDK